MKKQNRCEWLWVIGISIVIIIGQCALCFVPTKEDTQEQVRYLSPDQKQVVSIEITNPYETYAVPIPTDEYIETFDKEKLQRLWESLLQVPSYKSMKFRPEENYGFSPAIVTVKYKLSNGTQSEILVGSPIMEGSYCYAVIAQSDEVHMLSLENVGPWLFPKEQLLDMRFFPDLAEAQFEELNKIRILNHNKHSEIQWEKINPSREEGITKFRMVMPVEAEPGWESLYPKILDKINALEGLQVFEGYNENLPVDYELFLDISEGQLHLIAGRVGNVAWIKDSQANIAYEVNSESLNFMEEEAAYFLDHIVYEKNINEVLGVNVAFPQKTYTFSVDATGKMFYIVNGRNLVDSSEFIKIYQMICGVPINGILPIDEKISDELLLHIEITKIDKTVDVIECFAYTERLSAVAVNGKISFTTPRSYLLDLQTSIEKAGL